MPGYQKPFLKYSSGLSAKLLLRLALYLEAVAVKNHSNKFH